MSTEFPMPRRFTGVAGRSAPSRPEDAGDGRAARPHHACHGRLQRVGAAVSCGHAGCSVGKPEGGELAQAGARLDSTEFPNVLNSTE
eukprot:COSAG02_NODE_41560_length_393_cov_0.874150_1_plen_86_part_10